MKKIGVVLSGCGVYDGSEIYEATLTLLHVVKNGCEPIIMAPDIQMKDVVNHKEGKASDEHRNVLVESARLARGNIRNISHVNASELDAVIFPGGFGAAKNLSNWAYENDDDALAVESHCHILIEEMHKARKPLGFICIAPAAVAAVALREHSLKLTIGKDAHTARRIEALGHIHVETEVDDVVHDTDHNIFTTPAYMFDINIAQAEQGVSKLVKSVITAVK